MTPSTNPTNDHVSTANDSDRSRAFKQKRREKKKLWKLRKSAKPLSESLPPLESKHLPDTPTKAEHVEYLQEPIPLLPDPSWQPLAKVIEHFQSSNCLVKADGNSMETDHNELQNDNNTSSISKKKIKKLTRLTVEELKQLAKIPEVVEAWDVTASDPKLLVNLKSCRNTVPVPRHWNQRRRYLQSKNIEKPPFELPEFIKDTGIMEVRDTIRAKEAARRLGAKRRARLNPKLGKMDVDYQKLYEAFFVFQTKPKFTRHGELYYEGKHCQDRFNAMMPGELSSQLQEALAMSSGDPPPWLTRMQQYGLPPSYQHLKIPGVNAPIPEGSQWGFQPGGWGYPPTDEFQRPLYGQVFAGTIEAQNVQTPMNKTAPVDRCLWGELEEGSGSHLQSENTEDVKQEVETQEELLDGTLTPTIFEIPATVELQKDARQAYQVLSPQKSHIQGLMGSQHIYNLPKDRVDSTVDISLDPGDFADGYLDESVLRDKFEAQRRHSIERNHSEDVSDLYLEHSAKQAAKLAKREKMKEAKKKDFKF